MKPLHRYWQENNHTKNPASSKLEAYGETPIFIPANIREDVVKSAAQKI